MNVIAWAIALPTLGAAVASLFPQRALRRALRIAFALAAAAFAFAAMPQFDRISALFVGVVSLVGALAVIYATSIFPTIEAPEVRWASKPAYFLLFGLFWSSLLETVAATTFTGLWLGISATTLATTFLVGFSGGKTALEAAWKYLILCSFGIATALVGMLLLARAATAAGIAPADALAWHVLAQHLGSLQPDLLRIALLLMLLGFAVKAGLVPMHAWLPDAHSKAPAPVSAALSGLLVTCALYAIVRVQALAGGDAGGLFNLTLLTSGSLSMLLATTLMLAQRDPKRLLSYSTIEHSGLVAIALGIATPLGLFAAIFHAIAHAFAKSSAFLAVGCSQHKRTTSVLEWAPFIALGGLPPFATFVSEVLVIVAAVQARAWVPLAIVLVSLALGFAALARFAIAARTDGAPHAPARRTPRLAFAATLFATAAALAAIAFPFLGVLRP